MEPAVLGSKLVSSLIGPLVKKLFVADGPGAGLVDKPVRLSTLVSFRGEKRTLTEKDVHRLAGRLVAQAVDSPGEAPFPADEQSAVADALARRLLALGDLNMDDVQAVRLGHRELARQLHQADFVFGNGLSRDASLFLDSATEWACLQILEFFTRRSSFVARTLVEQSRGQAELIAKVDELIARIPRPDARDTAFERRYLPYVAQQHNHITIYGIDLRDSPDRWPLEVAYLSLEATAAQEALPEALPGERPPAATGRLPAEEALVTDSRVLLRGDAGSGKTTLVQWLAVTAARVGDRIPYVLPLRTLIRTGRLPTPADFLKAVSCPLTPPEGWAERVLAAGRGLVLVDGLDEIPAADRHRTRDWLRSLLQAYPGNHWLLTSRPTAVRPDWLAQEGFRELSLAPMRRSEVTTFVRRWHEAAQVPEYEGPLLDALRTKRDLARLATNPLMCGLICALHRERRGYLPTGRKELYDAALTMLLARRDRERGMGVELGEEVQLELLQRLAYALVLSGRTEMDAGTAEGIVERCLPTVVSAQGDAAAVLRTLLLRSGLLRQPAEGVVDFVHRTFQDYLAARYAVEEGHLQVLVSHGDDTQWEDVIRMAVAHARPGERAWMLGELLVRNTPRLTLLALACLEHTAALEPKVRLEVEARAAALIPPRTTEDAKTLADAGPLVLELLPGPDGLTDEEAQGVTVTASVLGAEEPDGALAVLRRFRDHPGFDVRRQLAGTWSRFDTLTYAAEVLDHLDRAHLILPCDSPDQRAALAGMRPWPEVSFRGPHHIEDILAALPAPGTLHSLDLRSNPTITDLAVLTPFSSLRRLWLSECPSVTGLERLSALPLDGLVFDGIADMSGLRSLRSLTSLSLSQELPGSTLTRVLPVDAPLEFLFLGSKSTDSTGLRGLRHWSTLQRLSLGPLTTELTVADWQEVADLPQLNHLYLNATIIRDFLHSIELMPELPGIEILRVAAMYGAEDLAALVPRLPGLRSVILHNRPGASFPVSRFAGLFPDAEVTLDR
ncbi:ATP-binding protein [Streptomyces cellostaticus]|uniref:ATP-binding protein n=1 Tax=Streptomyces cellostaticus TaxID=67285 RepID=A0A101NFB9_9ACTN|nr:NACHT domain-containing protein [Streptomyces cellostaticus]KUM92248.1 ATP-binding protein [Streptomyces cellostaticus]GHI05895.1 ATP-binding protein [Streptomyces cellostaticus]